MAKKKVKEKVKAKTSVKNSVVKKKTVKPKAAAKKTVKKKTAVSPKKKSVAVKIVVKKSVKPKAAAKKIVKKKAAVSPKKKSAAAKIIVKKSVKPNATAKRSVKKADVKAAKNAKLKTEVIKRAVFITKAEPVKKVKKYKPNKKTRYTKSELRHFRDIILKERKAIIESAKANMDALVDKDSGEYKGDNLTYSSHMAEQGTDEMEREKNFLFVQRDEKYLGYLQDALTRIDQGTYGICIDCRDEQKNLCRSCPLVAKERLELVPITQHCIECKNLRG